MNSTSIAVWLVMTAAGGVIAGLSWRFVWRIISGANGHRPNSLPPNGKIQEEEAWLRSLRQRVSDLEISIASRDRQLQSRQELTEQLMESQESKISGLRDQLQRLRSRLPSE